MIFTPRLRWLGKNWEPADPKLFAWHFNIINPKCADFDGNRFYKQVLGQKVDHANAIKSTREICQIEVKNNFLVNVLPRKTALEWPEIAKKRQFQKLNPCEKKPK